MPANVLNAASWVRLLAGAAGVPWARARAWPGRSGVETTLTVGIRLISRTNGGGPHLLWQNIARGDVVQPNDVLARRRGKAHRPRPHPSTSDGLEGRGWRDDDCRA